MLENPAGIFYDLGFTGETRFSSCKMKPRLLVKGETDYLADKNGLLAMFDRPREGALEAIGGTGDTLTGIVTALINSGLGIELAAIKAAEVKGERGSGGKEIVKRASFSKVDPIPVTVPVLPAGGKP